MLPRDYLRLFSFILLSILLFTQSIRTTFAEEQQNVSITAVVPANPTDFTSNVTRTTIGPFGQDEVVGVRVDYGSLLSYPVDIEVEASWSLGIPDGANTGSVDLLRYELGSASKAYGNVNPVIDLTNRTITWNISSFPGNLETQSVTFNLRTSSTYVGKLDFTITSKTIGPGSAIATDEMRDEFLYPKNQVSSSTSPTPTPTPTGTPGPLLESVSVQEISPTQAAIAVKTKNDSDVSLLFGTNPKALTKGVSSSGGKIHYLTLAGLSENQQYFFQVKVTSGSETMTSELFTFKTAVTGQTPTADRASLVVVSNNVIVTNPPEVSETSPAGNLITLPRSTPYVLKLRVNNSKLIKRAETIVRNKSVLGLSTFLTKAEAADDSVQLLEFSPSVFEGKLRSPLLPGIYELSLRLSDKNGGIHEEPLIQMKVSPPLTITSKKTGEPIADARIALYYWNDRTQKFEFIAQDRVSIDNPLFTSRNGETNLVLPPGSYQANVFNIGYKQKTVKFSLVGSEGSGYPTISLDEAPLTIGQVTEYLFGSFKEVFLAKTLLYLDSLSSSNRFFHLTALAILASLSIITILSFGSRVQLSILLLPAYLFYHLRKWFQKEEFCITLSGLATDADTGEPLSHANVYIMREHNDELLGNGITNRQGKFVLKHCSTKDVRIVVLKIGYQSLTLHNSFSKDPKEPLNLKLTKHTHHKAVPQLVNGIEHALSMSFEALMVSSLIGILFIGLDIGWKVVAPFAAIAFFNLVTWILHQKNAHQMGKHF